MTSHALSPTERSEPGIPTWAPGLGSSEGTGCFAPCSSQEPDSCVIGLTGGDPRRARRAATCAASPGTACAPRTRSALRQTLPCGRLRPTRDVSVRCCKTPRHLQAGLDLELSASDAHLPDSFKKCFRPPVGLDLGSLREPSRAAGGRTTLPRPRLGQDKAVQGCPAPPRPPPRPPRIYFMGLLFHGDKTSSHD